MNLFIRSSEHVHADKTDNTVQSHVDSYGELSGHLYNRSVTSSHSGSLTLAKKWANRGKHGLLLRISDLEPVDLPERKVPQSLLLFPPAEATQTRQSHKQRIPAKLLHLIDESTLTEG